MEIVWSVQGRVLQFKDKKWCPYQFPSQNSEEGQIEKIYLFKVILVLRFQSNIKNSEHRRKIHFSTLTKRTFNIFVEGY